MSIGEISRLGAAWSPSGSLIPTQLAFCLVPPKGNSYSEHQDGFACTSHMGHSGALSTIEAGGLNLHANSDNLVGKFQDDGQQRTLKLYFW